MKVSVLIHNVNRAPILARCLASVAEQSYRPLEVTILDAGSDDDSVSVISLWSSVMTQRGITVDFSSCPLMGVAASRNLAAQRASGDLLFFLDNDATLASSETIGVAAHEFQSRPELAVISARILRGDGRDIDPATWVYRRPKRVWSEKSFDTFTFTGGGCCIRSTAFREVGGFWEQLQFSREEEEIALALLEHGWQLLYAPQVTVRHYPGLGDRSSRMRRRSQELRNGLLIFWRRFPLPVACLATSIRLCSTFSRISLAERRFPAELLQAVTEARREWRAGRQQRMPVSFAAVMNYLTLHVPWQRRFLCTKRRGSRYSGAR